MKDGTGPNILLITTDQQRYDTCGQAAPSFMRTPHYNNLVREGITFTNAYADCPLCVPARLSLMTGKYGTHYAQQGNGPSTNVMGRKGTLPDLMREAGYQTSAIGKMHFNPQRARHGFEEMIIPEDYYREMERSGNPLQPMRHGLDQCELFPSLSTVPEPLTLTSWITEQCVRYIKERRDPTVPFFLWCSYSKPHPPLDPPEPYYSMYDNYDIPEPVHGDWSEPENCPTAFERFRQTWGGDLLSPETIRKARSAYYGLITHIDYNLGRLMAALFDAGLFDDTLILYTSDHGEYLGDHYSSSKVFLHQSSVHIPFVMRLPRSWDKRGCGTEIDTPVTHADILPTLLAASGSKKEKARDGMNLINLHQGNIENPREYLEMSDSHWGSTAPDMPSSIGLTDGHWKYLWYPEGGYEQLFNLDDDPRELTDLSADKTASEKLENLRSELTDRQQTRGLKTVQDGRLISVEKQKDDERTRRANVQKVFATEWITMDVRH